MSTYRMVPYPSVITNGDGDGDGDGDGGAKLRPHVDLEGNVNELTKRIITFIKK